MTETQGRAKAAGVGELGVQRNLQKLPEGTPHGSIDDLR
jgi:hypothetical protein